jgi:hypothetical protein
VALDRFQRLQRQLSVLIGMAVINAALLLIILVLV